MGVYLLCILNLEQHREKFPEQKQRILFVITPLHVRENAQDHWIVAAR